MDPASPIETAPKRSAGQVLKSYFYWTYTRGSFHYDILVTLILLFIFITPHLWDYGDKPPRAGLPAQTIQVIGDGDHGLIITVQASEVNVLKDAPDSDVKRALKRAIEPVTGDAVSVERWELTRDSVGRPDTWKVWAHR
jgi:hypothetical protein